MANEIIRRLEKKLFPGLQDSIVLKEVYSESPFMLGFDRYCQLFNFDYFMFELKSTGCHSSNRLGNMSKFVVFSSTNMISLSMMQYLI